MKRLEQRVKRASVWERCFKSAARHAAPCGLDFSNLKCCRVWPFNSHPAHPYFILPATANLSTHAHLSPDADRSQDKEASESVLENRLAWADLVLDLANRTRHSEVLPSPSRPGKSIEVTISPELVRSTWRERPEVAGLYLTSANIQDTEQNAGGRRVTLTSHGSSNIWLWSFTPTLLTAHWW